MLSNSSFLLIFLLFTFLLSSCLKKEINIGLHESTGKISIPHPSTGYDLICFGDSTAYLGPNGREPDLCEKLIGESRTKKSISFLRGGYTIKDYFYLSEGLKEKSVTSKNVLIPLNFLSISQAWFQSTTWNNPTLQQLLDPIDYLLFKNIELNPLYPIEYILRRSLFKLAPNSNLQNYLAKIDRHKLESSSSLIKIPTESSNQFSKYLRPNFAVLSLYINLIKEIDKNLAVENFVLYIPPINFKDVKDKYHVNPDELKRDIRFAIDRLQKNQISVVNFSDFLDEEYFFQDLSFHTSKLGRDKIAQELRKSINLE